MFQSIQLPQFFSEVLTDTEFDGPVRTLLSRFGELFGDPTRCPQLFPEYTDHGVPHVQRVLNSAEFLISDSARSRFTPENVALLVSAVLLHDSAMRLTREGFLRLITLSNATPLIREFDSADWVSTWQQYYAEAMHWNELSLQRVFGNSDISRSYLEMAELVRPLHTITDLNSWNTYDDKFAGEFVRRHHARLAHEFALAGFPGVVENIELITALPVSLRNLAGLVARSHNHSLRDTFSFLKKHFYGRVTVMNSHPVFLMALLRIADYLDLGPMRAPAISPLVRSIRNPVSHLEWEIPPSIHDVHEDEEDMEALFIVAHPDNVQVFLRLRALLDGLQDELDHSWSVLGEVYSRQNDLRDLGLRLRRVRSNLDDIAEFRSRVDYVPQRFEFQSAGAPLMRKLTEPLYGDQPEVGIRELLQNAIDAVREAKFITADDTTPANCAPITIRIQRTATGEFEVIVEDFGIGMTEMILQDYFLRAGSTIRESSAWSAQFAPNKEPCIIRSGRFGIGVLAAFLLGNEIEVHTRHISMNPEDGLHFCTHLGDDNIEVRNRHREHPGTTIRVKTSEKTYQRLCRGRGKEWDWYRWSSPNVERWLDGNSDLPRLARIPEPSDQLSPQWHRLADSSGYEDVIWTFGRVPRLVCNGINIGKVASSAGYGHALHWEGSQAGHIDLSLPVRVPSVAVVDKMGLLPIDLQRYGLVDHKYPFAHSLLADIGRDFVAFCLVFAPTSFPTKVSRNSFFSYPGLEGFFTGPFSALQQWFFTNGGSGFQHWCHLSLLTIDVAYIVVSTEFEATLPLFSTGQGQAILAHFVNPTDFQSAVAILALANILGRDHRGVGQSTALFTANEDVTVLLPMTIDEAVYGYADSQCDLTGFARRTFSIENGEQSFAAWGNQTFVDEMIDTCGELLPLVVTGQAWVARVVRPSVPFSLTHPFAMVWSELIGSQVIPYSIDDRRRKFTAVYDELADYIQRWESLKALGRNGIRETFRIRSPQQTEERF